MFKGLKWRKEVIKEVALMYVPTSKNQSSKLGQTAAIPRTLPKHLAACHSERLC